MDCMAFFIFLFIYLFWPCFLYLPWWLAFLIVIPFCMLFIHVPMSGALLSLLCLCLSMMLMLSACVCQGVGVSLCFPPVLITVPSPNVSQLFLVVFVIVLWLCKQPILSFYLQPNLPSGTNKVTLPYLTLPRLYLQTLSTTHCLIYIA